MPPNAPNAAFAVKYALPAKSVALILYKIKGAVNLIRT